MLQVSSQVSVVMELASQGYQGFKRLGSSASAQHSITYRKTTSQVGAVPIDCCITCCVYHLYGLKPVWISHLQDDLKPQVIQFLSVDVSWTGPDLSHKAELQSIVGWRSQQLFLRWCLY